jgi:hypothetical protein
MTLVRWQLMRERRGHNERVLAGEDEEEVRLDALLDYVRMSGVLRTEDVTLAMKSGGKRSRNGMRRMFGSESTD